MEQAHALKDFEGRHKKHNMYVPRNMIFVWEFGSGIAGQALLVT